MTFADRSMADGYTSMHWRVKDMLFPFGWPDIAACRAPLPLLVQYDLQDDLFTETGMQDTHARLQSHYASVGHPDAYTGQFYPGHTNLIWRCSLLRLTG